MEVRAGRHLRADGRHDASAVQVTRLTGTAKARGITGQQVVDEVLLKAQPSKRFLTIDQVAALTAFLARDAAASMTGVVMPIDGGRTAWRHHGNQDSSHGSRRSRQCAADRRSIAPRTNGASAARRGSAGRIPSGRVPGYARGGY
ncbi:SDR family oxidoreductase [Ralstonia sp. 151470066-2]